MGKRGPKPKPTYLRAIEGDAGRLGINTEEPTPSGVPECSDHLSDDAKAKWREVMSSVPPGMITIADAGLLEAYCEAWAAHKDATEQLASQRDLFGKRQLTTESGKPSPLLRIQREAAATMASLSTRLGLSPADRSGLKLGKPSGAGGKWADLIG